MLAFDGGFHSSHQQHAPLSRVASGITVVGNSLVARDRQHVQAERRRPVDQVAGGMTDKGAVDGVGIDVVVKIRAQHWI